MYVCMYIYYIALYHAIRPCHPSHSMPLALMYVCMYVCMLKHRIGIDAENPGSPSHSPLVIFFLFLRKAYSGGQTKIEIHNFLRHK